MNLKPDDLQPELWVAITALRNMEDWAPKVIALSEHGPVVMQRTPPSYLCVSGVPYQIKAVDLPFLVLWCPVQRVVFPADFRYMMLKRLDKDYVACFLDGCLVEEGFRPASALEPHSQLLSEAVPRCPRCHGVVKRVKVKDAQGRAYYCPRCGPGNFRSSSVVD